MLRKLSQFGLLVLACQFSGCAQIYDYVDEGMTHCHDKFDSKIAWDRSRRDWKGQDHRIDFANGFKNGYYDAIQGGGQCPPTIPPRKYWSVHNRGPEAECRVVAWYDGYSMGVAQAHSDGMTNRGRMVTSAQIHGLNKPSVVEWPTPAGGAPIPELVPPAPGMLPPAVDELPPANAPVPRSAQTELIAPPSF